MFVAFDPCGPPATGALAVGFGISMKRPKGGGQVLVGVRTGELEVSIPPGLGAEQGWIEKIVLKVLGVPAPPRRRRKDIRG